MSCWNFYLGVQYTFVRAVILEFDTNHVARNGSSYATEYSTVFNSEGVCQLLFEDAGVGRMRESKVLKRKRFEAESCMHVLRQRCRVKAKPQGQPSGLRHYRSTFLHVLGEDLLYVLQLLLEVGVSRDDMEVHVLCCAK